MNEIANLRIAPAF